MSARRSSSPRNGSGVAGRGKASSRSPQRKAARTRRARSSRGLVMATTPGAPVVVGAHLDVVQDARELVGRRHERAIDARQALELAQGRAQRPGDARVERLGAGQHPSLAAVRGGEQRAALGGQAPAQRGRVAGGRRDAVELVQDEVGMVGLPQRPRLRGRRRPLDAGALLEAVGQVGPRELARGAQPGEQVVGAAAEPARSAAGATRPRPSAVWPAAMVRSSAKGISSSPKTCSSSAACSRGSRRTTATSSGAKARSRISRATWAATSSISARSPPPSSSSSASPGSGRPVGRRLEQRALERVQRRALVVLGAAPAARRARGRAP